MSEAGLTDSDADELLTRQAETAEQLGEAVEDLNELLRDLVDAVAYGGQGR